MALINSYIDNFLNKYVCGDCLDILKQIPSNSIDLIMTSPPYADQIKNYGDVVKKIKPEDYVAWFVPRAKEFYRVLKDNGSFVLNINDKTDGSFQNIFVFKLVVVLCEEIGFNLVRDYIWYNPATPPNVFSRGNMGRTKKSHEYCFWFSKSESWTFNMDPIRKPYSKSMMNIIEGKETERGERNKNTRPSRHNFDLSHPWENKGGSDPGSVIVVSNTASNGQLQRLCKDLNIKHPARYPEKLAEFFILSGTNEGDIVLDPFAGSGTTGVAAVKHHRNYICIDINSDFQKLGNAWISLIEEEDVSDTVIT